MALVVVGTSECTYYTKNFAYHRQNGNDKVYSLALDEKDVVFGAQNKVEKAIISNTINAARNFFKTIPPYGKGFISFSCFFLHFLPELNCKE